MHAHCIVVGAGLSGLAAARSLKDQSFSVMMLDKGRGVGGRVATRRHDQAGSCWDHGAQFVTFRHPEMVEHLQHWNAWDLLQPWHASPADSARMRLRPATGMNAFAKRLAEGLDLRSGTALQRLVFKDGMWTLHCNTGLTLHSPQILLTAPPPQILDLLSASELRPSDAVLQALHSVRYNRCLSLLAECAGPSGLPEPGIVQPRSGHFSTLIDHQRKGISQLPLVTAHARPDFSLEWYDRDRTLATAVLRAALAEHLASPIVQATVHGWKFAEAAQRIPLPFLEILPGLHAAGDAFESDPHPPRIESALLSGLAYANAFQNVTTPRTFDPL
jgi:predicted NAD/FAD-dependent oxidoreductase